MGRALGSDSGSFGGHIAHPRRSENVDFVKQFAAFRGPPEGASEGVWFWVLVFVVFFLAKCRPFFN